MKVTHHHSSTAAQHYTPAAASTKKNDAAVSDKKTHTETKAKAKAHASHDSLERQATQPKGTTLAASSSTASPAATAAATTAGAVATPVVAITRTVNVANTAQLNAALAAAKPGDKIQLAPGTYTGPIAISGKTGVTVSGPATAILKGAGSLGSVFAVNNCNKCTFQGITVTGGTKAMRVANSNNNVISDMDISHSQAEALHLLGNSCNNTIQGCTVHDTGLGGDKPIGNKEGWVESYMGEGIYIGESISNVPSGDRSNNNNIIGNTIYNTTAENIDIKEYTQGGVIAGNSFNGSELGKGAVAVVAIKGNDYQAYGNTIKNNQKGGIATHVIKGAGVHSGQGNSIHNNQILS